MTQEEQEKLRSLWKKKHGHRCDGEVFTIAFSSALTEEEDALVYKALEEQLHLKPTEEPED